MPSQNSSRAHVFLSGRKTVCLTYKLFKNAGNAKQEIVFCSRHEFSRPFHAVDDNNGVLL